MPSTSSLLKADRRADPRGEWRRAGSTTHLSCGGMGPSPFPGAIVRAGPEGRRTSSAPSLAVVLRRASPDGEVKGKPAQGL